MMGINIADYVTPSRSARGAEFHSNTDFLGPPTYREGDDSIDTGRSECDRESGQSAHYPDD